MRDLYRAFLEEEIIDEALQEEYDYGFSNNKSNEAFSIEFKKFMAMYRCIFYNEDRFVTVINSNEIALYKDVIKHLFNLYIYAKKNNLQDKQIVLIEFLYTYYKGITSNSYKANYTNFRKTLQDFMRVLSETGLRKEFFTSIRDNIYYFYKRLVNYGIENEMYIDSEIINRIFNNLKVETQYYNELINIFIDNKNNLQKVIYFDNEKNKHLDVYIEYMLDSLNNFVEYDCVKEMLLELDRNQLLNFEICKNIVNKYIITANKLCNKLKNRECSFINGLNELDLLKGELNYILNNINSLNSVQKNKIKEVLIHLLRLKRNIILDDEYINREMHEISKKIEIDNTKVDLCKDKIIEDPFSIYAFSKVDFVNQIGRALESFSKYPMQSMVKNYRIDNNMQRYSLDIESSEKKNEDSFKKYFDEKGKEYTQQHPELLNKLSYDYYEEYLRYLSKTFSMQQGFIITILGEEFRNVILKLKNGLEYDCDNEYAIVINNILNIEKNIASILRTKNLAVSEDGFKNINSLLEMFKEDKESVNGLMYLNYILYEKSGVNLRNNMMHGNLINTDMSMPLLVSFSGLIFVSWLKNVKK